MTKFLIVLGVVVMAACSLALGKEQTTNELRKSFIKLTDYLDDKLPNNDNPEANFEAVKKYNGGLKMFKSDISSAIEAFKTIANGAACDSSLFEAIQLVQRSTQAQYPNTQRRADKVLRSFIERALKKCHSYHEQALKEALAEVPSEDRTKVEDIISDKFIETYEAFDSHLKRDQLTFLSRSINLGFDTHPLARAVWMEAKDDPENTIELREAPKPEDRRAIDTHQVECLFKNYIIEPCEKYNDVMDVVFGYGEMSSKFFDGGEQQFLKDRSKAYQNGLIRRHLCEQMMNDPEGFIRDASTDFEIRL